MIEDGPGERTPLALPVRALVALERRLTRLERWLHRARKRRKGLPLEVLVELDWRLGDEVMALPVFEALKRREPEARIAARVRHPGLLLGNPHVTLVNPLMFVPDLVLRLRGEEPGRPRRATLARRAGVDLDGLLPRVYLSAGERSAEAAPGLLALKRPVVAIHAGTTQACKDWPRERWLEVAGRLGAQGASLVEVGDARPALSVGLDLLGKTGVRELARVLAQVDLLIAEDSGPVHLALAVGTRALGLYGATDPGLLHADDPALARVVSGAACRFCWPRRILAYPSGSCPLAGHPCMAAIPTAEVVSVASALLSRPAAAEARP